MQASGGAQTLWGSFDRHRSNWLESTRLGPTSTDVGQNWANFGRAASPTSVEFGTTSTNILPRLANFGESCPGNGQTWPLAVRGWMGHLASAPPTCRPLGATGGSSRSVVARLSGDGRYGQVAPHQVKLAPSAWRQSPRPVGRPKPKTEWGRSGKAFARKAAMRWKPQPVRRRRLHPPR